MEIDYGLALDFIDDRDDRPYQLWFRRDDHFSDTGQLIAVIAKADRPDNGHTIPISRPGENFNDVESAVSSLGESCAARPRRAFHRVWRTPDRCASVTLLGGEASVVASSGTVLGAEGPTQRRSRIALDFHARR